MSTRSPLSDFSTQDPTQSLQARDSALERGALQQGSRARPAPTNGMVGTGGPGLPAPDGLVPTPSLPKGGGALSGLGEKLSTNPLTGTGSFSVPINTSPGRVGGPELSLSYDSGAGNGPFGIGWQLSLPSIVRKTDRGLPRYLDEQGSDTFLLAGAEDLVPALEGGEPVVFEQDGHRVHRYRPRIESGFARIERWRHLVTRETHWRVTDGSNITSWFGRSEASRVADPADPRRVFRWLLDEVRDDRGNVTLYQYKAEDLAGVETSAPWEANRGPGQAQRYLKRILYGNRVMHEAADFLFELALDHGEHGPLQSFDAETQDALPISATEQEIWPARADTFSSFRAGFDVRTRRLCRRLLMFHHFPELDAEEPVLVASTDLTFDENPVAAQLRAITRRSYERDSETGLYRSAALPPLELTYQQPELSQEIREVAAETLADLGTGVDGSQIRLTDLDGEGLPGLLVADPGGWRYKEPRLPHDDGNPRWGPATTLHTMPTTGTAGARLMDLDGDGQLSLVDLDGPRLYARVEREWRTPRRLESVPNRPLEQERVHAFDVDGDGLTDFLVDEGDHFTWYRGRGKEGFAPGRHIPKPSDGGEGGKGSRLVYGSPQVAIFLADMTGDGLADIVRIGHGDVIYWPNLGFGRFASPIHMAGLGQLDHQESFRADRVRLGDIDGSGTSDLLYLGSVTTVRLNQAGNSFAPPVRLRQFPATTTISHADLVDLTGSGTADLVWSSSGPRDGRRSLRYIELMAAGKPYLLTGVRNNLGLETRVRYRPSTYFYLRDKAAGRPWSTRLPFPVQVIERVEILDHVRRHRTVSTYAYRHGYFDGAEREFRGFGMVEQRDAESFEHFGEPGLFTSGYRAVDQELHKPPVLTRSWFHTGAFFDRGKISRALAEEYWSQDPLAPQLPDTTLPPGLTPEEARQAVRALQGVTLRQEVYALDGSEQEEHPYTVIESTPAVRLVQPGTRSPSAAEPVPAVFFTHPEESITCHYERDPADPRIHQSLVLDVDSFGQITRSAEIAYPRRSVPTGLEAQGQTTILLNELDVHHQPLAADRHRLAVPIESRSFELTGVEANGTAPLHSADLRSLIDGTPVVPFEAEPVGQALRLLSRQQTLYYSDDLTGPGLLGEAGRRALPFESRTDAFSVQQIEEIFTTDLDPGVLANESGHLLDGEVWRRRSARQIFDASRFFLPIAVVDPFGNETQIEHDTHNLLVRRVTDSRGGVVDVELDYRVLAPRQITDPNQNRTAVAFDTRGMVVASAVMGKELEGGVNEGDSLEDPTRQMEYDPWAFFRGEGPAFVHTLERERHGPENPRFAETFVFSDGAGNIVQTKAQAEPGPAPERDADGELVSSPEGELVMAHTNNRWVGTGRVVLDNKGNPVKQYEPFFSDRPDHETEAVMVEQGVTPILLYDPLGRLIRTDLPDGTLARVELSPWLQREFDPNDTVLDSHWRQRIEALEPGPAENAALQRALQLATNHADTPTSTHLDPLGRGFRVDVDLGGGTVLSTHSELDIQGNVRRIVDARNNVVEERIFGMIGQVLQSSSVDAGVRRFLSDGAGTILRKLDSRGFSHRFGYDSLRRPTHHFVTPPDAEELLANRTFYGEDLADQVAAVAGNLRGQVARTYDSSGLQENLHFDVNGNLESQSRRLARQYATTPEWSISNEMSPEVAAGAAEPDLEPEIFTLHTTYDAMSRPLTQTTTRRSTAPATEIETGHLEWIYNEALLLEGVQTRTRGEIDLSNTVTHIDYDAKGQRTAIGHGNGTTTTYIYERETFRLVRLTTFEGPDDSPTRVFQDLRYTYDPVGNIVAIRDDAQQTLYYDNQVVSPHQRFEYDPSYRLIRAEGREHNSLGQPADQGFPAPLAHPHDGTAMRTYVQQYTYDAVGNLLEMAHNANLNQWTRRYSYAEDGNQLLGTSLPGDGPDIFSQTYAHDENGNMASMPHLSNLAWDHGNHLRSADRGGGGLVFFTYDTDGQRIRKIAVDQTGTQASERIYLGPLEIYREHSGLTDGTIQLDGSVVNERETFHIDDGVGRICCVETPTIDSGVDIVEMINVRRYQHGNHLGSVALELDQQAQIISYEEYHPYGSSSFRAANGAIDVSASRFRYTGKERDEETGLYYHGARYYAPWLARWTAVDPLRSQFPAFGSYVYSLGRPVNFSDPSGMAPEDTDLTSAQNLIKQAKSRALGLTEEMDKLDLQKGKLIEAAMNSSVNPIHTPGYLVQKAKTALQQRKVTAGLAGLQETVGDLGRLEQKLEKRILDGDFVGDYRSNKLAQALEEVKSTATAARNLSARIGTRLGIKKPPKPLPPDGTDSKKKKSRELPESKAKAGTPDTPKTKIPGDADSFLKKGSKFIGERALKALPLVPAVITLVTSDAPARERIGRAIGGELGIGPLDLEMVYDLGQWLRGTETITLERENLDLEYRPIGEESMEELRTRYEETFLQQGGS